MNIPQPGAGARSNGSSWEQHPQTFEVFHECYPVPAGLEYVAATYEEIGARADSDASPNNELLFQYTETAFGEAYWAHRGTLFKTGPVDE